MDVEEEVSRHLQALRYVLKASGWTQGTASHLLREAVTVVGPAVSPED
jgi:hypothetical protein